MLQLAHIRIEGFKALDPVEMPLHEGATFIIGSNGVGKSSILQALSFIRAFGEGRTQSYFESRGWNPRDIYPKTQRLDVSRKSDDSIRRRNPPRPVRISLGLRHHRYRLYWEFAWSTSSQRASGEYLYIDTGNGIETIFSFGGVASDDEHEPLPFKEFRIDGSLTSIVRPSAISESESHGQALTDLQHWYEGITSLELLSPLAMRRGARGKQEDIGPRGEYLASFLASISADKRSSIVRRLQRFYPLDQLSTTRKRAGWVDMQVHEQFKNFQRISPSHMSDGFFRLLGMCAIPEFEHSSSLILLDEVEDGIEPHVLPELIRQIDAETDGQLVMTSHSPLLVNNFDQDQIVFVARDQFGRTAVALPNEIPNMREGLEFFGSGELWANADREIFYDEVRTAGRVRPPRISSEYAVGRRARKYFES